MTRSPWKQILDITVAKELGEYATDFDVEGITDEFVKVYGYVDIATVNHLEYAALVLRHNRAPQTDI